MFFSNIFFVVYNSIPLLPVGAPSGNQPKQKDASKDSASLTNTNTSSGVNSKSLTDTLPLTSGVASDTTQTYKPTDKPLSEEEDTCASQPSCPPSDNNSLALSQAENRGAFTGYTTDLFGDQFEPVTTVEASQDVPKA